METLLGGDKLLVMALVILSGGGNFIATKQSEKFNAEAIDRATIQVGEIYRTVEDAKRRIDQTDQRWHEAIKRQEEILTLVRKLEAKNQ